MCARTKVIEVKLPKDADQPDFDLKPGQGIPREFEVTAGFYVTATIKLMACSPQEARDLALEGHGTWPAKKDWDASDGDTSYEVGDWGFNETQFMRITRAR